jgi:hypothetical protein
MKIRVGCVNEIKKVNELIALITIFFVVIEFDEIVILG